MRHEGTRIAMGGTLLGLGGAAIIALLIYAAEQASAQEPSTWRQAWFVATFAISALLALVGAYVLAAVWLPLPVPATGYERTFQPRLSGTHARAERIVDGDVVFAIATNNEGRDNVDDAMVNVVVPEFLTSISRCSREGETGRPEHAGNWTTTAERLIPYQPDLASIYWNGNVSFPGQAHRLIYFRVTFPGVLHDFPLRLIVESPALPGTVSEYLRVRVDVPELPHP